MRRTVKPLIIKEAGKDLPIMIAGGLAILIITQIPMRFANQAKEKEIEQVKEQDLISRINTGDSDYIKRLFGSIIAGMYFHIRA